MREPMREIHAPLPSAIAMSPRPAATSLASDEVRSLGPKKKPMLRELSSSENEDAVPAYAQPPFWARKSS
jgi:hypothetical protein